ncbi:MAG: hypothetical protein AAGD43_06790 [Pseudomonadota bacterium]
MIQKLGITKTYWEKEHEDIEEEITNQSPLLMQELRNDESIEILAEEQVTIDVSEEAAPAFPEGMAINARIRRRKNKSKARCVAVPPEEFKVSQRSASLEEANYKCHETEKTRGELLSMGFEFELIMMARQGETSDEQTRRDTRFFDEERRDDVQTTSLSDRLLLLEEYYDVDLKGSGDVKMIQAFRIGKTLLQKEEVDHDPFDTWSADRIPHRLIGLALADKVKQTQRVKTVLTRQMLDNVYLANNPRTEVPEQAIGENTIQDLLQYQIGGLIRTKQPNMLNPIETPDRSSVALQAIQYMDSVREMQSGVVRNGQAINSEEIDPKSAYQSRREDRNSQVRKRLMARMFAETLLVPLFRKLLKLIVKYQDAPREIQIAGKWVLMDPRSWNAELRAEPATGLGHANKEEELGSAQIILAVQTQALEIGMCTPKQLWNTGKKLVRAVGWHNPEDYFVDPESPEGKQAQQQRQQKPDPAMMEAQAKIKLQQQEKQAQQQLAQAEAQSRTQLAQAQAQHQAQMEQMKQQAENERAAQKLENERVIAEVKIASEERIQQMRIDSETQIAYDRMQREDELARWKAQREQELAEKNAQAKADLNGGGNRPGGRLDA